MKIKQNPLTGEINYQLDIDEVYDASNHLAALSEFVSIQAI
jgi:hypothetical protein